MAGYVQDCVAVLFAVAGGDMFSVVPGDLLEAVADAEDGDLLRIWLAYRAVGGG